MNLSFICLCSKGNWRSEDGNRIHLIFVRRTYTAVLYPLFNSFFKTLNHRVDEKKSCFIEIGASVYGYVSYKHTLYDWCYFLIRCSRCSTYTRAHAVARREESEGENTMIVFPLGLFHLKLCSIFYFFTKPSVVISVGTLFWNPARKEIETAHCTVV